MLHPGLPSVAWTLSVLLVGCAAPPAPPALASCAPGPRVTVDVDGVDLADVMERIGDQAGRMILVDPSVQELVTVSLRDASWRDAVDVIARMTRSDVEERAGGVLVLTQAHRVRLQCCLDADVRTVVQLVAAYHGANAALPAGLHGRVQPPAELPGDVREMVLQVLGPLREEYTVIAEANGELVRVLPRTITGEVLAHDEASVLLRADGRLIEVGLPPASATGALGERRSVLLRQLRFARRGDRACARCDWSRGAPELIEFMGR